MGIVIKFEDAKGALRNNPPEPEGEKIIRMTDFYYQKNLALSEAIGKLTASAYLIYSHIIQCMNSDPSKVKEWNGVRMNGAWPSYQDIRAKTGVRSDATITKALKEIQGQNLLQVYPIPSKNPSRHPHNFYASPFLQEYYEKAKASATDRYYRFLDENFDFDKP